MTLCRWGLGAAPMGASACPRSAAACWVPAAACRLPSPWPLIRGWRRGGCTADGPLGSAFCCGWADDGAGRAAGAAGRLSGRLTIEVEPPLLPGPRRRPSRLTLAHTRTLRRARMPRVRWALAAATKEGRAASFAACILAA